MALVYLRFEENFSNENSIKRISLGIPSVIWNLSFICTKTVTMLYSYKKNKLNLK